MRGVIVACNALSLRPHVFDGGATVTLNLLRELPALLPEARFVVFARADEERLTDGDALEVRRLGTAGGALRRVVEETALLGRTAGAAGADVFLSPHESVPLRLPCPLVVVAQNLVYQCGLRLFPGAGRADRASLRARQAYYGARMARTYGRAAAVVAVSQNTVDVLERRAGLDRAKTSVTLLGSDSYALPEPEASGERAQELLVVSAVAPYKNIGVAIRALARLRADRPELRLTVAGGDWRGHLGHLAREAERLGVADRVDFCGPLGPREVAAAYGRAALLVHLSDCEACPLPVLEAMRFGLPVVAASRSSLPEVVGPAGVLVDPGDEAAVAAALGGLLDDADGRAELARLGRERAAELTWRAAAEHVAGVLRSAAAARN